MRFTPAIVRSRFGPYLRSMARVLPLSPSSTVQPATYPSCCRISAMCTLILECGMTTRSWYAELALRRRVSMSAIGSVIVMALTTSVAFLATVPARGLRRRGGCGCRESDLPGALGDAGQLAGVRHLPQTDPTQAERAVPVSYTHLRAHETPEHLVCRLLLEKKKKKKTQTH